MDNTQNMDYSSFIYPQIYNGLNLDDYSQNQININISTINNATMSSFTIYTSETAYINKIIGEKDFPYPNIKEDEEKRDIPEIDIIDENFFKNGESIGDYLKNIENVVESKFNTCRKCTKNYPNKYFCKICDRNLCVDCSKECMQKKHKLIDLIIAKQGDILTARTDVTRLIDKRFKEPEKNELKGKKEYNLDEPKIYANRKGIKESVENYSRRNDFLLMARIVLKDYTNYYHYENILSCYRYLANRFLRTLDKNCLKIIYDVEKENKEIQIFHPNFVEKNKDKLTLIVNNELSDLVDKVTVDEDYLEVILFQESKHDYITDLSYMFSGCTNLLSIKEHLDHKLIDFSNVGDISHMFENCVKISKIDFSLFKILFPFDKLKMDNIFCNCKKLINITGFPRVNIGTLKNNIFYGCDMLIIQINNNNISLNSNNNDNINLSNNDNKFSSSNENNSNKESSLLKQIKSLKIENQKLKEEIKSLKENVKIWRNKYEEIEKNEENKKTLNDSLKTKDYEKAFETAIKIGSIENIFNVLKIYHFKYNKEKKDLSKNILANLMSILCEDILSCEKPELIVKFILRHICKKDISFDKGLNKVIYDAFYNLSTNGKELSILNIKEEDILQIVEFFKNKI